MYRDLNISGIHLYNREIKLPPHLFNYYLKKSIDFSIHMERKGQSIEYYNKNRNASFAKNNIILGKMGEVFAAFFIKEMFGLEVFDPDFTIYKSKFKSWEGDLGGLIHVKTCDYKTFRYVKQYSWTLNEGNLFDVYGKDNILKNSNHSTIIFVYMDDYSKNRAIICFMSDVESVKPYLRDPISKKLKGLKKCIYYDDILVGKSRIKE